MTEIERVTLPPEMYYESEYGVVKTFKRNVLGGKYRLTDADIDKLTRDGGQEITITVDHGNRTEKVRGRLEGGEFTPDDGDRTIPFVAFRRTDYNEGVFAPTGEKVRFKQTWGANEHWPGHTFSESEVKALLAGEVVGFTATNRKGSEYEANGRLGKGDYGFGFQLLPRE